MKTIKENYLDFYKINKIIPTVDLKDSNLTSTITQRRNFYINIGLTEDSFQNKTVLELGPGTGYNAYFLLKYGKIKNITLVDANFFSLEKLKKNLATFKNKKIINRNINSFKIKKKFDFVIIENVLGGLKDPKKNFKTILKFIKPGGSIILTLTEPVGIFSEKLRFLHSKLLLKNLSNDNKKFFLGTKILSKEFSSHLATLGKNTRICQKWVQDNMLNELWIAKKNYFSFHDLYKALDKKKFLIKNSSPNYNTNFGWYKNFNTKNNNYNFLINYLKNKINLIHIKEKFDVSLEIKSIEKIEKENFKIFNLIIMINELINKFNINSKSFKKNLIKINQHIILLSKLFCSNSKIAKSLIEFSSLLNNYMCNNKKRIKYNNYKNFWGHTTCPIIIYKMKNLFAN